MLMRQPDALPEGIRAGNLNPGTDSLAAPRFLRQAFTGGDACEAADAGGKGVHPVNIEHMAGVCLECMIWCISWHQPVVFLHVLHCFEEGCAE